MTDPDKDSRAQPNEQAATSDERLEKRRKKIVAVGFFLLVIILWLAIHFLNRALNGRNAAEAGRPQFVTAEIVTGGTVTDIARLLAEKRIISGELLFTIAATLRGSTNDLKAGEYRFDTTMSLLEILSRVEDGRVMLHEFTIPEGYTVKHIADRLDELGLANANELMRLAENPAFRRKLGVEGSSLEGFLFPDTYKIAKGLSGEDLLRIMVDKLWSVWNQESNGVDIEGGRSIAEIITIASITEREALYDDEKPLIASVIYNRLKKNMPLQCDVTIRYPLDNYGVHLTYADLGMDSPYNTYLHKGLPPTPICSPGLLSIRAALKPPSSNLLYFVSMNNGRHKFSDSLQEHNRAVYKYQILNERG